MNWTELPENLKDFLLFLPFIIAIRFFLRPRRPKVIYAHFNRMLSGSFWIITITVLTLGTFALLNFPAYVVFFVLAGFTMPGTVYLLYWSQPFSRKRTGVKEVDEAVERYKKPGERVEGAWAPPMELGGKRYWNVYYGGQSGKEWMLIDEQGQVLRDEAAAHTLRNMLRLVYQIAHPEYINSRTSAYMSSQKGIKGIKKLLEQYEQFSVSVREHNDGKYADEMLAVRRAAEVLLRFHEGMCKYWLHEADWGNRRGGTKLKEFCYSDWQELIGVLHQNTLWLRNEIETMEKGALAAKKIRRLIKEHPEIAKRSPSLQYLLDAVITQHDGLKEAFDDLRQGRVRGYERGLDDELKGWHSRLEWVRQVDEWTAQGLSGKALEAQKQAYLAEQARLERERKREERRRRREERQREREERERQRAAAQAGVDPEQQN